MLIFSHFPLNITPLSCSADGVLVLLKIVPRISDGAASSDFHVIETTELSNITGSEVKKMELIGEGPDAHVYIGTESELFRVPVQSCSAHTTCCECVASRDPYCGFSVNDQTCMPPQGIGAVSPWIQDIETGDTGVCANTATSGDVAATTDVATPGMCGGGGGGGGVVIDNTNTSSATPPPGPDATMGTVGVSVTGAGLNSRDSTFADYTWIIVGTVGGFVGGVVIGVVVAILIKCSGGSRRNKNLDLTRTCEITNDTNTGTPGEWSRDLFIACSPCTVDFYSIAP